MKNLFLLGCIIIIPGLLVTSPFYFLYQQHRKQVCEELATKYYYKLELQYKNCGTNTECVIKATERFEKILDKLDKECP